MATVGSLVGARLRSHNRPPEEIPADARVELRQRLERDYADLLQRCLDLEVAMTQLPQEVTSDNEGRITDFLGKQLNPFVRLVELAHEREKSDFLALGRVCDEFFTIGIRRKLMDAAAPLSARMSRYRARQREIAREIQREEQRLAEEARRIAQDEAMRQRLLAQETAPLDRSEAREHMQAAKKAEAEAAEASRIINAPPDPGRVYGDYGATGYLRDNWTVEVEDITQVPWNYITVDFKRANDDVAAAVREAKRTGREPPGITIPGLTIRNEPKFVAKG